MGVWINPTNLDPKAKAEADTVYTLAKANGDSLAIALTQYAAPVVENGPQAILGNEDIFDKVSSNVQNETGRCSLSHSNWLQVQHQGDVFGKVD